MTEFKVGDWVRYKRVFLPNASVTLQVNDNEYRVQSVYNNDVALTHHGIFMGLVQKYKLEHLTRK